MINLIWKFNEIFIYLLRPILILSPLGLKELFLKLGTFLPFIKVFLSFLWLSLCVLATSTLLLWYLIFLSFKDPKSKLLLVDLIVFGITFGRIIPLLNWLKDLITHFYYLHLIFSLPPPFLIVLEPGVFHMIRNSSLCIYPKCHLMVPHLICWRDNLSY